MQFESLWEKNWFGTHPYEQRNKLRSNNRMYIKRYYMSREKYVHRLNKALRDFTILRLIQDGIEPHPGPGVPMYHLSLHIFIMCTYFYSLIILNLHIYICGYRYTIIIIYSNTCMYLYVSLGMSVRFLRIFYMRP